MKSYLALLGLLIVGACNERAAVGQTLATGTQPKIWKPGYAWLNGFDLATDGGRKAAVAVLRDAGLRRCMLAWTDWADPADGWKPRPGVKEFVTLARSQGIYAGAQLMPVLAHPEAHYLDRWRTGVKEPDGWEQLEDVGVEVNIQVQIRGYAACGFAWAYADGWEGIAERDAGGNWINYSRMLARSTKFHDRVRQVMQEQRARCVWYETSEVRFDGYYLDQQAAEPLLPFTMRVLEKSAAHPDVPITLGQCQWWHPARANASLDHWKVVLHLSVRLDAPVCVALYPGCTADSAWSEWATLTRKAELKRRALWAARY